MSGIIFNIRSFSVNDGPGIRQTIFFKGCPMRCLWCHNPESQDESEEFFVRETILAGKTLQHNQKIGCRMSVDEVMQQIMHDVPFFEESGGGITLSGGEPLMQPKFAADLLHACQLAGIHTAIDTCGYAELSDVKLVMPFTNLFLYDLKIADDAAHRKFTGLSNHQIFENLQYISASGKKIFIRIPLIPDITDTIENLTALKSFITQTTNIQRVDLLPWHSSAASKYDRLGKKNLHTSTLNYPPEKAEAIREFFHDSAPVVSIGG